MKQGIILGFSGEIASGKSTVAKYYAEKSGWPYVSFGDYVRKVAQSRGLGQTREVLQEIGARLVEDDLEGFCRSVLSQVNWQPGDCLVVDGIRHTEVQFMLRSLVVPSSFLLVYLEVSDEVRKRRLVAEGIDLEYLKDLEKDSTEIQVKKLLPETADFVLQGNKPLTELIDDLDEIVAGGKFRTADLGNAIEPEDTSTLDGITEPFDPALIRVESRLFTLDLLLSRIRESEIDLAPDFQRQSIWTEGAQSRLVESVLLRIPLPAFYMDATNEDRWLVVDGLQRLTALTRFVIKRDLRLRGLEFLKQLEGREYIELPRNFQRRIAETQVTVFLIEKETPAELKFNIFKRINTGGMPLSAQEIRHALNQGPATRMLAELANSNEFKVATGNSIKEERMADRECVLRFLAFTLTDFTEYKVKDFDRFLNDSMARLNGVTEQKRDELKRRFLKTMKTAHAIFGQHAFRKRSEPLNRKLPINKALFEAWSVILGGLDDEALSTVQKCKDRVRTLFLDLLKDPAFHSAISQSTGDVRQVYIRFEGIAEILRKVLS